MVGHGSETELLRRRPPRLPSWPLARRACGSGAHVSCRARHRRFHLAEAAKRVGVTAAAPYRHFSDRNELMGELAGRGFQLFGERLARAWDEGRPSAMEALYRMGAAYLAFAQEEPGLYAAMFGNVQTLAASAPGAAADAALETLRRASVADFAQLRRARQRGARSRVSDMGLFAWRGDACGLRPSLRVKRLRSRRDPSAGHGQSR